MVENPPSLTGLIRSLWLEAWFTIRQNRLAAILSLLALVMATSLAISSDYDERPRYRELLLPDIQSAEARFQRRLHDAETASSEIWRLYHFVYAHQDARDALKVVERQWPRTPDAVDAHAELVRYYRLVSEEIAIIRTRMGMDEDLDYLAVWKDRHDRLLWPVHERWSSWIDR